MTIYATQNSESMRQLYEVVRNHSRVIEWRQRAKALGYHDYGNVHRWRSLACAHDEARRPALPAAPPTGRDVLTMFLFAVVWWASLCLAALYQA